MHKVYLAIDLGAGSGRVLAGLYDGKKINLEEVNRFENNPVEVANHWHWNINNLYDNILNGLTIAASKYGDSIVSLGIDTWGVDYALLGQDGALLNLPYQYRDVRTDQMMERAFSLVDKRTIYEKTGIQFMFFNTIFQLLSELDDNNLRIKHAENLLFIPDLIGYWLTGIMCQERSIASTSQLYNPTEKKWDYDLIKLLGLPQKLFKELSDSGSTLGKLSRLISGKTGLKNTNVISVAGHDTASAVAAIPSQLPAPAFLSSGTWSLMGIEIDKPIINSDSYNDAFTNESGANGSIRFLKNICGLWLIQECKREWSSKGIEIEYEEMASIASEIQPFRSLINPDNASFTKSGDMVKKIQSYCRETNQKVPESNGEIIRCVYESLALRYSTVWDSLLYYATDTPQTLHVVGGGCQDRLLNQFTADALGVTVIAGPVEATGLGNIIVQMIADSRIDNLLQGRQIVLDSSDVQEYQPSRSQAWPEAKDRFKDLLLNE